ncbi:unnamed protein product [Caenorhabditis auriculariae]|uniref:Uncharacterized protein n=1 Tax=Caenorhabditis auriculariae TaxID=2777116 RepID=A0A8S1HPC3_9PELO|nr:unnamed protein product [Caenorhabditis auriculariae]
MALVTFLPFSGWTRWEVEHSDDQLLIPETSKSKISVRLIILEARDTTAPSLSRADGREIKSSATAKKDPSGGRNETEWKREPYCARIKIRLKNSGVEEAGKGENEAEVEDWEGSPWLDGQAKPLGQAIEMIHWVTIEKVISAFGRLWLGRQGGQWAAILHLC